MSVSEHPASRRQASPHEPHLVTGPDRPTTRGSCARQRRWAGTGYRRARGRPRTRASRSRRQRPRRTARRRGRRRSRSARRRLLRRPGAAGPRRRGPDSPHGWRLGAQLVPEDVRAYVVAGLGVVRSRAALRIGGVSHERVVVARAVAAPGRHHWVAVARVAAGAMSQSGHWRAISGQRSAVSTQLAEERG